MLTLQAGSITSPQLGTDVTIGGSAGRLSITASGQVGAAAAPLTIDVATLEADTSASNSNQFFSATTVTLTPTGLNAGTGTVQLNAGTFNLGGSNRIHDDTKLNVSGANFAIAGFNETIHTLILTSGSVTGTSGILTGQNNFQVQSGTLNVNLAGTVGLDKTMSGTVTASGLNLYTGETTISAGIFQLGPGSVIPNGAGRGNVFIAAAQSWT